MFSPYKIREIALGIQMSGKFQLLERNSTFLPMDKFSEFTLEVIVMFGTFITCGLSYFG